MHGLLAFQWSFVWEHRGDFAGGLEKTLKISVIAIAGAFVIGVVLGAARARRIRRRPAAVPRGGVRARLRPRAHVRERDAADRRADCASVLDQHLRLGLEEHSGARPRDRLRRADERRLQPGERQLPCLRALHRAGRRLPRRRLDAVDPDPTARAPPAAPRGPAGDGPTPARRRSGVVPSWVGPVAEYMARKGLETTLKIAFFSVLGSAVVGILLGTLLTIRFLP